MSIKIVSQLDDYGFFIAPTIADESQLEEGVFIIPGGAVDIDPPNTPDGMRAFWNSTSSGWEFVPIPDAGPDPDPEPLPPIKLDAWQIRKALNYFGLRSAVEAAISASGDVDLQDAWQYAPSFVRTHPLVVGMGPMLGKTDAEIDAVFDYGLTT